MGRFWIPKKLDKNGNLTTWQGELTETFDEIKTIGSNGLSHAFYECDGITGSVNFPTLTSVDTYGLSHAFYECTGITSVNFPTLKTVGSYGLNYTFRGCTGITGSISFPALTSVDNYGLDGAFNYCTEITELHFRADAKSVIENADDYSEKFGASNATIYFDL